MIFEVGSILLIKNFHLPTKVKDKFFIVIGHSECEICLLSMTTSQIYFDQSLIQHGLITDRDMSMYCFEKDRVIGKCGFAFYKHTFVSMRNNILEFTPQRLDSFDIEYLDCLTNQELMDLIYSIYKKAPPKHGSVFEKTLNDMAE